MSFLLGGDFPSVHACLYLSSRHGKRANKCADACFSLHSATTGSGNNYMAATTLSATTGSRNNYMAATTAATGTTTNPSSISTNPSKRSATCSISSKLIPSARVSQRPGETASQRWGLKGDDGRFWMKIFYKRRMKIFYTMYLVYLGFNLRTDCSLLALLIRCC